MPVVDAHHHFWRYDPAAYDWIPDGWAALRRDHLPDDLARELAAARVDGVVTVQARQTVAETEWLLGLAARHDFVRGVVGWLPLVEPDLEARLDAVAGHPAACKLRGFRHVLQAEPDEYFARSDFDRGLRALERRGHAYDLLVIERQLPAAIALVDRHPGLTIILDHLAKPRVAAGDLQPWARRLRELARRPNVACKLSGLVTEADVRTWTPAALRPYFEVALEAFGPDRLLFGSDWPVCLAGVGYVRWREVVEEAVRPCSPDERAAIFGGNAVRLYRLP